MAWFDRMDHDDRILLLIRIVAPIIWRLEFYLPYDIFIVMTMSFVPVVTSVIICYLLYWEERIFDRNYMRVRKHTM
jgi:hypothetical protein